MDREVAPVLRKSSKGDAMRIRARILLAAASVIAAAVLGFAGTASATLTRHPESFSPLTGTGSGFSLEPYGPSGVAVDEATGNVFVTDAGEGVVVLGAEGGAPVALTSPLVIQNTAFFEGNSESFVAYDNSASSPGKGDVYTYNNAGAIKKYVRDSETEQYVEVVGGEISVPACGRAAGGAVDSAGDLDFTCAGAQKIYEFSPAGALLHEYVLQGTPITYGQVAVDALGDLFVQTAGGLYKLPANGFGEIEPTRYEEIAASATGVAYDPEANELVVAETGRVVEYDATSLAKLGEFGDGQLVYEFEGTVYPSRTDRVALNLKTHRVYVVDSVKGNVAVFGPDVIVPTVSAGAASGVTGTKATLSGSVNPEGIEVTECFFEYGPTSAYGTTASCEGSIPTDSEPHPVSLSVSGLTPNGATYHYRVVARNKNGVERSADKTLVTAGTVVTEAAAGVTSSTATLHGYVRPEGLQYSECLFEYGAYTATEYEHAAPCEPGAAAIEPDFSSHAVTATLDGLQPNAAYRFRLVATSPHGTASGEEGSFTTVGPPQISELTARNASSSAVTLEAKIDPSGSGTIYRFEWGPTTAYGSDVPVEFEPYVGSGSKPVLVTAKLSGLTAGTVYHYRVVATSESGTTTSPDAQAETLDACGLPNLRCFELVSPRDVGPVASPGSFQAGAEMHFQASTAPGAIAYVTESGLPEATKGAEVLYLGARGSTGWDSTQLSPPIVARDETQSGGSGSSATLGLSNHLSCGFVVSAQPLTEDAGAKLAIEAGGADLYRRNADGSYTAVTALAPENRPSGAGALGGLYRVAGFSSDCGKVVFETKYLYSGVGGVGSTRLYEWDEGTLRNVGLVPNGSGGESAVEATPGTSEDSVNVVSEDGTRVFFSAKALSAPNAEEVGATAIFVRENGSSTKDISQSQTGVPDGGATYQYATPDGSRVFFTANAGLTSESSTEGTDLYEYNLEDSRLTDLSVEHLGSAADAVGLLGASADGRQVYFAALGQLVRNEGVTLARNESEETYSVYAERSGVVSYVGPIGASDVMRSTGSDVVGRQEAWTSEVSANGRYLLFESRVNITGYDSGGRSEAYLYDATSPSDPLVCVSCRRDGEAPVGPFVNRPLTTPGETGRADDLVEAPDGPEVYFMSFEALAPGAAERVANIYEWAHGQVFRVTSEPAGIKAPYPENDAESIVDNLIHFAGASANGQDLYVATPESLTWEDGDERSSVYDARVEGGFPKPAPPQAACAPNEEGSCQGAASQAAPTGPVGSAIYSGPGNAPPTGMGTTQSKGGNAPGDKNKKPKRRKHKKKRAKKAKRYKRKRKGPVKGKQGKKASARGSVGVTGSLNSTGRKGK